MKKYRLKIGAFFLIMIAGWLSFMSLASAITVSFNFANYYYERFKDGVKDYNGTLKRFVVDNQAAFCIEPGIPAASSGYSLGDMSNSSLANEDVKRQVFLYAYYGYSYNHYTSNYRAATQALIWEKILGDGVTITFSKQDEGVDPVDISQERAEITRLVERHDVTPSFSGKTYTVKLGSSKTLNDTNNILSEYEIVSQGNAIVNKGSDDSLIISPTTQEKTTITFKRKSHYSYDYKIYYSNQYQDLIVAGEGYPVTFSIDLIGEGGKVTVEKVDGETMASTPQGEATLKGAVYGVYKLNGELVLELTTDKTGHATSKNILDLGDYYLQEITPSKGYELDTTKYYFSFTQAEDKTITVKEQVIKRKYNFIKVLESGKTGLQTPEAGIEFEIYKANGDLVGTYTTDAEGRFVVELPYGKYILKQKTVTDGYEMLDDYHFEVKESGEETKVFADGVINAYIKIIKVDAENGKKVPLANIKFKIFDVQNNCYVTQILHYPNPQKVDVFATDKNGVLVTPEPLESGVYRLEEVDAPIPGYLWNKETIEFTIDKNTDFKNSKDYGKILEITFTNYPVKGQIKVTKKAQDLELTSEGYKTKEHFLKGVKFGLYARENIYAATGELIYRKNTKIGEYLTDEKGNILINDLYLGKYYLKELVTLDKYILDENEYDVVLDYQDQYTAVVTKNVELTNQEKMGQLQFLKLDSLTNEPLEGVSIEVYTEQDELIFSGQTDAEGKIILDLPLGNYYLKEVATLPGYTLDSQIIDFTISDNEEIITCTLKNDPIIEVIVPDTYKENKSYYFSLGLFILLLGYEYKKLKS